METLYFMTIRVSVLRAVGVFFPSAQEAFSPLCRSEVRLCVYDRKRQILSFISINSNRR